MYVLREHMYGLIAGIIVIMIALDIILVARGILPVSTVIALDFVILGALLVLKSIVEKEKSERLYYSFWGVFMMLISGSIAAWTATGDGLVGLAVFFVGIGGLIIYASIMQK